jgi:phosphate acetyltransferase
MFDKLLAYLKAKRKTIVFTEGTYERILSATDRLLKQELMDVILCGNVNEVAKAAKEGGFDVSKATVLDPLAYAEFEAMVDKMLELRKGKMTREDCASSIRKSNYFDTMLVKMGNADALLVGATYSTADTVRPALQLVKTKPGANLFSTSFILFR